MLGHAIGLAILSARMVTCQSASWQKNDTKGWDCERIWQDSTCGLYWSHHFIKFTQLCKKYQNIQNLNWTSHGPLPLSSLVFSQTSCTGWNSSSPRKASQCWSTSPKPHNHAWPWSLILRQVATHAFGWSHRKAPRVLRNWELITAALMPVKSQITNMSLSLLHW